MKKIAIILMFLMVIGFTTHKAEAKTLKQLQVEILSLAGRVKTLSQQASVLMMKPSPGLPVPNVNPVVPSPILPNISADAIISIPDVPMPAGNLFSQTLHRGDKSPEVLALQQILIAKGYFVGLPDGKFGLMTEKAVKDFQRANGQKPDGVVGTQTMTKMEESPDNHQNEQTQTEENKETTEQKQEEKKETIEFITKKNNTALFADYSCKEKSDEKLSIFTGEYIDETKNAIGRLSDVWSTTDGTNWKQEAKSTNIGEGWERMVVKIQEDGVDTVYSFGGKYLPNSGKSDNGIYKSTDMVKWSYVGDIPEMSHYYDRSVVYYKDKFWLLFSEEGKSGVWSSSNGEKWTQVLTNTPWDGLGEEGVSNDKGTYKSNSLGGYVIDGKMWYLVYNKQQNANYPDYGLMSIYSTTDGKNWKDEGYLKNSADSSYFNISPNNNPFPVAYDGKIWIISNTRRSQPIVINTEDGKNWNLVSNSSTQMIGGKSYSSARYYPSTVVFQNKLWTMGGWDVRGNSNANDNGEDIFSSTDGVKWTQMKPKGVSFPGPADRWLAGAMAIGSSSPKATSLEIQREYNASNFFTGSDEKGTTLGKWNLIANADKNKGNTGDIVISDLSFLGTDYKSSTNKEFSTLEELSNITVYVDDGTNEVKVGSIQKFNGPFYDKNGEYALPQKITLDKPYTIKNGKSVWVTLKADFPAPKFKNLEMRTWLAGIGFVNEYSTPCTVYTEETTDGNIKSPGRNLYDRNR